MVCTGKNIDRTVCTVGGSFECGVPGNSETNNGSGFNFFGGFCCVKAYHVADEGRGFFRGLWSASLKSIMFSASEIIRFMASTTITGCFPTEVSALSMTASAPSNTALATSVTSARVGDGLVIMLSISCVATITGLERWMHLLMIIFAWREVVQ